MHETISTNARLVRDRLWRDLCEGHRSKQLKDQDTKQAHDELCPPAEVSESGYKNVAPIRKVSALTPVCTNVCDGMLHVSALTPVCTDACNGLLRSGNKDTTTQ